jgi:Transposase DDE domain
LRDTPPKQGRQGKEVQSNITDNQSAKMASSHGVIQGYNANALVDEKHQVVVAAVAFGDGDDGVNAGPMLEAGRRNLIAAGHSDEPLKGKIVSANTSYYSVINLEACENEQVDAYIPDREFRKRDPRFAEAGRHRRSVDKHKKRYESKKHWFTPADFKLDEKTGKLICPAGKTLYQNGHSRQDGYQATVYRAPVNACRECPLRAKCLRHPQVKARQVSLFNGRISDSLTEIMKRKIDTPEARRIYGRRLANVEPVFGNLRAQKGLDRFTLRGQKKVNIQWTLYCMMHNIEKIGKYGVGWN